ncbi:MAG: CPBP family intramembrane metalloprotease [Theionarchaea archaeon]|nr:CPBP family intramembrane metalloprotease [Theionarchaea archaeon]
MNQNKFENRNLWLFFLIAFGGSWIFWIPEVLWDFRLYIAPFGPSIAAFLLTYMTKRQEGTKELFKRGLDFKFKKIWLIPIFLLMPMIVGCSLLLAFLGGEPVPDSAGFSQPFVIIPAFFYILFLGGPVAEEFGWRGYALDRLQPQYSALYSSLILGIIWGLWHIPLFFMEGQDFYRTIPMWGFIISTIFNSILHTWIYNNTGRSILAVLLFHTTGNLAHFIFPAMATLSGGFYSLLLNAGVVVVVLVVWGPQKMVRERPSDTLPETR